MSIDDNKPLIDILKGTIEEQKKNQQTKLFPVDTIFGHVASYKQLLVSI